MDKTDLLPNYSKILTTQQYAKKPSIAGVRFLPLTYHRDDTGEFVELGRFDNGIFVQLPGFRLAQISTSLLLPGAVKAFHLHFNQTDVWFVSPHQRLLVGLLDTRKSSPTVNATMRFILGAGVAQLLVIPPGVAHGAANPWTDPVSMTYFTDRQFDPGHPDEHRLPFDLFGKDFWLPSTS
jgi:dTDP-4-dehydrorhamnose 3,5-epimerase